MLHHRAFGRRLDTLSLVVVDNRRPMLSLLRAMLAANAGPIETYDNPAEALDAMSESLPDLVIVAAAMQPITARGL
jgi:two-component SAPR family response regulator